MSENSKIISRVKNGELSICNNCKVYNLIYNNIFFQFSKEQLFQFKEYLAKIDVEYWLTFNSSTTQKRKIPIATFHKNLILVFNYHEIEELKILLDLKKVKAKTIITTSDIDYTLILN
ncbi:DUF6686 family protein [Polaribacter sp. Asnod1-A03]|uniref:DUF6686 family protein n=1 Tax=Polaribacter sp. Asnod1-A03 TaxID=3160581 RepID=UPI00386EBFD4